MKEEKGTQSNRSHPNFKDMPLIVGNAYEYFLRGIAAKETAILLKVSLRTVQRWKKNYHFEEKAAIPTPAILTIQQRAVKLSNAGLSYSEIGQKLGKCKATIYNYVRQYKEESNKPETIPDVYQPLFNYLNEEFNILPLRSDMDELVRLGNQIQEEDIVKKE